MQDNVDLVRKAVAAWQDDGVEGFLRFLDPGIEFSPVEEEGWVKGHEGVRGNLEPWFETWADYTLHIPEVVDAGMCVVVALRVTARGKSSGVRVDMTLYEVFELREGLVVKWQEFTDREQALEAASHRE